MSQELEGTLTNSADLVGTFGSEGGGGTSNYNDLINKPSINSVTLQGNKTASQLGFAEVATSGNYNDLSNKPTIPAAQVNSDWNASSGVAEILNKPTLSAVATSGNYNDLTNKPTIPAAQIQSDWSQADNTQVDYIKNKPTIPAAQIQSDWSQADNTQVDYIKNKPTVPANATDLPISGNDPTDTKTYIDNKFTYSTTEKVVGKWIDDKSIYEKTISLGYLPDNTSSSTPHNISDLKFIIDFQGFGYITNSVYFPLPFVSSSPIYVAVSTTDVTITTTSNRSTTQGYITLRYVKN